MEDPESDTATTIMDLPEDCHICIFKWLHSGSDREAFGLTCHKWLEIQNQNRQSLQFACSLSSFKYPLSQNPPVIGTYELHRTLNRFQHLQSLSLSGCTKLSDSSLKLLQCYGSSLRALCLDCCFEVTDKGLSFVASGCPLLIVISLYRCSITDLGLETLAKSCLALEDVNLSYCSFIGDHGLRFLVQNCVHLNGIRINSCKGITGVGFQGCSQALTHVEAEHCKLELKGISSLVSGGGLEYLDMLNLDESIRGYGLSAIGAGFATKLRVLNLRLCRTIGDESVAAIAKGCPLLVEWNLAVCREIRVAGWESIALNCHNLKELHVNRCSNLCDRGLHALKNGCKKLSVLFIDGCPQISQTAIELFRLSRSNVVINGMEILNFGRSRAAWCHKRIFD